MSAVIAIKIGNGLNYSILRFVKSITDVAKVLLKYYKNPLKVTNLISRGDLRHIGMHSESPKYYGIDQLNPKYYNYTISYDDEFGGNPDSSKVKWAPSLDIIISTQCLKYNFIFMDDRHWYMYNTLRGELVLLKELYSDVLCISEEAEEKEYYI